jgi:hypothetical protein
MSDLLIQSTVAVQRRRDCLKADSCWLGHSTIHVESPTLQLIAPRTGQHYFRSATGMPKQCFEAAGCMLASLEFRHLYRDLCSRTRHQPAGKTNRMEGRCHTCGEVSLWPKWPVGCVLLMRAERTFFFLL